jgi:riboflavin kinase / FMN adenylyltransferase
MRVARWPAQEAPLSGRSVVTLGVFDGVHLGHVRVIGRVEAAARQRGCDAAVVTFDRHPSIMLAHEASPAITSLEHRLRLFAAFGVDVCVVVQFTEEVARMPAQEFARRVFRDLLGAQLLVLGFDARFGRGRQGDVELCRRLGPRMGWQVESVPAMRFDGRPVSSTAIRQAIAGGDLQEAERLLGRPFSLYGTVVAGEARGRRLGYPTANLDLHNELLPPEGIYLSRLFIDGEPLPSVTSIGRQPTFPEAAHTEPVVEVHVIDCELDLYGRDVEVQFVRRLRGQVAFSSPEALREQIGRDVEQARQILARQSR